MSDYEPLRSWLFGKDDHGVVVREADIPDTVMITVQTGSERVSAQLSRAQFEALCLLGSGYRPGGDYVRYLPTLDDILSQEQETGGASS